MMKMNSTSRAYLMAIMLCALQFLLHCNTGPTQVTGGSSDTEVCGIILDTSGQAVTNTRVMLLPTDYNPTVDGEVAEAYSDTTNAAGEYTIALVDTGEYNIYAVNLSDGRRLLRRNVAIGAQKSTLLADTIKLTGKVSVAPRPEWDPLTGYVFIEGTPVFTDFVGDSQALILDSVPAQILPAIFYGEKNGESRKHLISADGQIRVISDRTVPAGAFTGWSYVGKITVNTTISGANIPGNIHNFPLLIRLNRDNFPFSEATSDGRDLRFSNRNHQPLSYHLERWDSQLGLADIWVLVDTIRGNSESQFIQFYWGNDNASDASSGSSVFNSANGFEGVWHLSDTGVGTRYDASDNGQDARPVNFTGEEANPWGIAGGSVRLGPRDQQEQEKYLQAGNPEIASGSADQFTISLWMELGAGYPANQIVLSKANDAGDGYAYAVLFDEYGNIGGEVNGISTLHESRMMNYWNHVVLRYDGNYLSFWLNGIPYMPVAYNGSLALSQTELFIGADALRGGSGYEGGLDEIRVSSVARSNDWIRLCFVNQGGQPFIHITY